MPRLAVPLTDTAVRNAKPDASKPKGHTLPDGGGLYLHITQAGKYWRMDYRRPNGKRNTLAFGVYPATSLAQARERRELARGLLALAGLVYLGVSGLVCVLSAVCTT